MPCQTNATGTNSARADCEGCHAIGKLCPRQGRRYQGHHEKVRSSSRHLAAVRLRHVCASAAAEVALTTTFDPSEVAWFSEKGTGAINGQAFFQTRGGQPRTCAGLEVSLQPKSGYGRERLLALYGSAESGYTTVGSANVQFIPDSADYKQARKTSVCDAQGNFSFTGLPAGEYFLTTGIMWSVPGQEFMPTQGGLLMQSVKLSDGESTRVIMTR